MFGVISSDSAASADNLIPSLQEAFKDKGTQGVILRINSPGGSPVQAGQINDEIRRLRAQYPAIPFYAVVEDICASGGYYVAVAADKIFVDKASLIARRCADGRFGHRHDGEARRGTPPNYRRSQQGFLDPFRRPIRRIRRRQTDDHEIHQQFIDVVAGRQASRNAGYLQRLVWNGQGIG
jgi:protease-4